MSSRSTTDFDAFLARLPLVPLTELCRHLDSIDLIPFGLKSNRLNLATRKRMDQKKAAIWITMEERYDRILVEFPDNHEKDFTATFQLSSEHKDGVHLKVRAAKEKYDLIQYDFFSNDMESLEHRELEVIALIGKLFSVEYTRIGISLGSRDSRNPVRLLASLPPGKGADFVMNKSCQGVNFTSIRQFLENVHFTNSISLLAPMEDVVESENVVLDVRELLEMSGDARLLTRRHMETMTFNEGAFGVNSLTSEDFHVFVKRWMEGGETVMKRATFEISEDQEIDLEVVLRGFDAKPWNPDVRDRTWPDGVDMKDGLDFENANGVLGTVLLDKNQLTMVVWSTRFPVQEEIMSCAAYLGCRERLLAQRRKTNEEAGEVVFCNDQLLKDIEKTKEILDKMRNEWL